MNIMKTILVDAINTFFIMGEWISQEMYELLEKFPNQKIILTNADEYKQKELWLVNLPYELFTLSFQPEKTDTEYYKIFLEKYWLNTNDVLYFEHNIDAVKSAESVGIQTYHYDKDKKDLQGLEQFLIKNL
jgi:HAD superfamily hydrolase (TIGR01509 family)